MINCKQQKRLQCSDAEVYELWEIIQGTLRIDMISKFDKLLEIMNASDDPATNGIAEKLSEAAGRPICTTPVHVFPESAPSIKPTIALETPRYLWMDLINMVSYIII